METKVIKVLNEARARELKAIIVYMGQHYELGNLGFEKLAELLKKSAIEEMKHAEKLAERIKYLGGIPTTKPQLQFNADQLIKELIKTDINIEEEAVDSYNKSAKICADEEDFISQNVFLSLLKDEQEHLENFQNIEQMLEKFGDTYLVTLT